MLLEKEEVDEVEKNAFQNRNRLNKSSLTQ